MGTRDCDKRQLTMPGKKTTAIAPRTEETVPTGSVAVNESEGPATTKRKSYAANMIAKNTGLVLNCYALKKRTINPRHVMMAVAMDDELKPLFDGVKVIMP